MLSGEPLCPPAHRVHVWPRVIVSAVTRKRSSRTTAGGEQLCCASGDEVAPSPLDKRCCCGSCEASRVAVDNFEARSSHGSCCVGRQRGCFDERCGEEAFALGAPRWRCGEMGACSGRGAHARRARLPRPGRRAGTSLAQPRAPRRQLATLTRLARAQLFQARSLLFAAQQEQRDRALAQRSLAYRTLLPAAIEVLERRRLAGTLLYGKCAPHEVEWSRQFIAEARHETPPSDDLVAWAPAMGYETYLQAAWIALLWSVNADLQPTMTADQKSKIFSFVLTAVDLMCAPRPLENLSCYSEGQLLNAVQQVLSEASVSRDYLGALRAAYDRLQASGAVARRAIDFVVGELDAKQGQPSAKAQADNAARGLHSCAHCGAVEAHVAHFKRCSACKGVVFCCKDCQLANWPAHKAACKAARKAAAGAAAGA